MDFSNVCRTCLGSVSLKPIFADAVDHTRQSTVIFVVTGIKVELNDGLPQHICEACFSFLNDSLSFRRQCKNSETMLLQKQQTMYGTIQEPSKFEEFTSDILKTELKCEFDFTDTEIDIVIKSENDSDADNVPLRDSPLCMSEKNSQEENCVTEKEGQNGEGNSLVIPQKEEIRTKKKLRRKKDKVIRVSCPVCQKDLSPRSLRAHVATHADPLQCKYCMLECSSKETLAAHSVDCPRKKLRNKSGLELVSCEECGKTMQRASLRAHVAVKHEGRGPVCEHCGRRFGNKLRLSEHLRAKHGYTKLRCSRCEFTSASRLALENHERRHRGEKPFVCEMCGAKFHAAYLLSQHAHSHRTERRVKCEVCGAAFKSSNGLRAHRQARHAARALRCPLCARAYSCRHYVVKHMRAAHGHQGKVPPLELVPAPGAPPAPACTQQGPTLPT